MQIYDGTDDGFVDILKIPFKLTTMLTYSKLTVQLVTLAYNLSIIDPLFTHQNNPW